MKITTITYTERKGMPNYCHEEYSVEAIVEEGKDSIQELMDLKATVYAVLYGVATLSNLTLNVVKDDTPLPSEPVASTVPEVVAKTEPKKTAPKKSVVTEKANGEVVAQIADEPAATLNIKKEKADVETYVQANKSHTSVFAGYLTKTYGDAWKTKPGVKDFSLSLNGVDFRDNKTGLLVDSFTKKISEFFGSTDALL